MNEIVEVLVASRVENPKELLEQMNISSRAVIANQGDEFSYLEFNDDRLVKIITTQERGVGKNRNIALDFATGDICILADDDEVLVENYREKIISAYKGLKDADMIIFNLIENNQTRYRIKKTHRVRAYNYMRYGAARISFKRRSISKHGIHFNIHFGGGTEHSAGEDVLFINSCLKKGLKIYAVNLDLAILEETRESTWFKGYNEKFFIDKGVLFSTISPRYSYLLCLQFVLRHRSIYRENYSILEILSLMNIGRKQFKLSKGYK